MSGPSAGSRDAAAGRSEVPTSRDVGGPADPASRPRPTSGRSASRLDELRDPAEREPVAVSVVHGSLADATYALMVGTFAGEQFTGVERFIDRQFGGELSSWDAVNRYPSALGTSRFIGPTPLGTPDTEPPGCYVIGLGPFLNFGRTELTHAVRSALLDRCLELYRDGAAPGGQSRLAVGVSSTLLGVQADDGLRIEDAVAAIVEGVLSANDHLARYETSRHGPPGATDGGRIRRSVRIEALELIDRYADRADRAVQALRSVATSVRLGAGDEAVRNTIVEPRPGGLPAGSSMAEIGQPWRRFLITAAPVAPSGGAGPSDSSAGAPVAAHRAPARELVFDVALLGRDARADHVQHRLDSVIVDALVERLSHERGDERTVGTLHELLIPHELRDRFLTAAATQFIVDDATANFPWELLTVPRGSARTAVAQSGAVIRQFVETADRRRAPVRSTSARSLVIGAGRVPGAQVLPAVYREAGVVEAALRRLTRHRVLALTDRDAPLDAVDVNNALFDDHQILHIASHGIYDSEDPSRTGAVLSDTALLTANLVRQLPRVPDIVFLNCCHLATIGSNRMAAGLAREFMAIGVRAVVAAAWSVDDDAAEVFARTFYAELVDGRSLGDAVATARSACAAARADETWAAYQCYGDPGFVLRGTETSSRPDRTPVSHSGVATQLESLSTRAADLGRAGRGPMRRRRENLCAEHRALAEWVRAHPRELGGEAVERKLAHIARDLGEYREAATRLLPFVTSTADPGGETIGLQTATTTVRDLHLVANCLARAAQASARRAAGSGDEEAGAASHADLDRAERIAAAAVDLLPSRESWGVLGSTRKRAAGILPHRRRDLLAAALSAYRTASCDAGADDYGDENALQLALVLGGDAATWAHDELAARRRAGPAPAAADTEPAPGPAPEPAPRLIDERRRPAGDYWARAADGDRALTALMAATDAAAMGAAADTMIAAYERAFASRSTWSQRQSAIGHLADLADVVETSDPRRAELARAHAALQRWELDHMESPAGPPA